MTSSDESSTRLSPTEEAFAEFLELQERGAVEFEQFCQARPELRSGLYRMHERWLIFDEVVSADSQTEGEQLSSSADASAERLLRGLRREPADGSRYQTSGEIGRGGMGRILKVWDRDLRRSLAMKVLQERGKRDPRSLARFLDEALVTGQLEHPGIVPVYELGLDSEGSVYFTMPFVRGENLQRIFERVQARKAGWSQGRALGVMLRVCEAVGFAHARGVVHRDLKPANVMVGPFGETYVMDWGLARILGEDERCDVPSTSAAAAVSQDMRSVRDDVAGDTPASPLVTMEGDVVGTPVYMAPEQAHGWIDSIGAATDIYSIGAMLYQLLTGSRPYLSPGEEDSSEAVLRAVKSRAPRPVHALADDVPPELEAICDKAMAREPTERYGSTMDLAADLQAFLEHRVVGAYETGAGAELRKWIARNRRLAIAIGAGFTAVLLGLAVSTALYLQAKRNENAALAQQVRADANADRIVEELRKSHLAQGRLIAANGQLERAEDILWREHLRSADLSSRWLLWELYARFPQRGAARTPFRPYDMEVTPDGSLLLVAGADEHVAETHLILMDSSTLAVLASLPSGTREGHMAVDAAGRRVLCAGRDGEARVWDLLTRREVARFERQPAGVRDAVYRESDDRWILGCEDGTIRVLDREGRRVSELPTRAPVHGLAISPGGAVLASSDPDGSISLWRGREPTPFAVLDAHRQGDVVMDFSADAKRLYAAAVDGKASEWDVSTGKRLATFEPRNGSLRSIYVGEDDIVAVGGWNRTDLIDAGTWEVRSSIYSPAQVLGFARPALDRIAIIHPDYLVSWDLDPERQVLRFGGSPGWLAAAYGDTGTLVLGERDGKVRLHSTRSTGPPLVEWDEEGPVVDLAVAAGGRRVAALVDGEVRVRDAASGSLQSVFAGGGRVLGDRLDFSPDGSLILAVTERSETPFELHRTDSGELVAPIGRPGEEPLSVRFSPTGEFVATVTRTFSADLRWQHWLSTWSLSGEERTRTLAHLAWRIAVSPDGTRIAAGQYGRDVQVFDLKTQTRVAVLRGHTGHAWSVDWHPTDPRVLASCSDDGTIRLWNADAGDLLITIDALPEGQLAWVRFGLDGESVAVRSKDDDTLVWDLTYFDRHIAGNVAYQIERLQGELGEDLDTETISAWAEATLARPWPRFGR